jgi:glycosyltransferase involved in cell wall biosynthesis
MRIAYVCADHGVPVFGRKGCSVHVQEIVRAFTRRGVHVELFAARTDGSPPADLRGLPVHELPVSALGDRATRERSAVAANSMLRAALEAAGPFDLVYERYSLWSTAGMEYAHAKGMAGLLEVNAPLIDEQIRYRDLIDRVGAERATKEAFAAATMLIVVSKTIARYVQQYGGCSDRVHVVPNGIDPARFPSRLASSLPAPEGVFTVGFLGSLKPWHGITTLVEAFAQVHRQARDTRLLVVGDGTEREPLIACLSARGLLEATHFTGAVGSCQVPGLLASMDVGVAPYPGCPEFYFSPMKVYEYMAAGLPAVASDIGQIAEVIEDEVDGLLCRPGDPAALTAALVRLRADPGLRVRLGAAARRKMLQYHSWDAIAGRVLDLARVASVSEARA